MTTKLKVLSWLYRSKKNTEGKAPIYIRITKGKQQSQFASGCYCRPTDWISATHSVTKLAPNAKEVNDTLYIIRTKIHIIHNELIREGREFHISEIKQRLLGNDRKQTTLLNAIRYHNELIRKAIGRSYAEGTYKQYKWFEDKVKAFIKHQYRRSDIILTELNHKFLTEFEHYLYHTLHNKVITAQKNITQLRKVVSMCIDLDWLDKMPFKKLKPKPYTPNREYLTMHELNILQQFELTNKRLATIRDKFIFQCYTGIAFVDLNKLTKQNFVKGIDGEDWIVLNRQKTNSRSTIPLLSPAKTLIAKYRDDNRPTLFPVCSNQKFNKYLKELCKLIKISKRVTTHTGRRTFATSVTLSNGVPIETVSKMLGHSDLKTTAIYATVVDTKVSNDMQKIKRLFDNMRQDSILK